VLQWAALALPLLRLHETTGPGRFLTTLGLVVATQDNSFAFEILFDFLEIAVNKEANFTVCVTETNST
jgi:hypothetical protein